MFNLLSQPFTRSGALEGVQTHYRSHQDSARPTGTTMLGDGIHLHRHRKSKPQGGSKSANRLLVITSEYLGRANPKSTKFEN